KRFGFSKIPVLEIIATKFEQHDLAFPNGCWHWFGTNGELDLVGGNPGKACPNGIVTVLHSRNSLRWKPELIKIISFLVERGNARLPKEPQFVGRERLHCSTLFQRCIETNLR